MNSVDTARLQSWRAGSSMVLFHCGGVTSASALAPEHFAFAASQLFSASISDDSLSWELGKRDDPQPSRILSAPRSNRNLELPPSTQTKGVGLMVALQNPT